MSNCLKMPKKAQVLALFELGWKRDTRTQWRLAGAFYPAPLALLGRRARVRWDAHLVRVVDGDTLVIRRLCLVAGARPPGRHRDTDVSPQRTNAAVPVCFAWTYAANRSVNAA